MSARRIELLLVDDHPITRHGIRMAIGTVDDIEVTGEAVGAIEAIHLVQENRYDIALLDIQMPDIDGLALLKLFRASHPHLPILMFSLYPETTYGKWALKYGAAGYLTKYSSIDVLVSAIRTVAGGGKYFSAELMERFLSMTDPGAIEEVSRQGYMAPPDES
jgi:DNA-binding NarL/FixJ family response regulator